jgi:hypothetical protein
VLVRSDLNISDLAFVFNKKGKFNFSSRRKAVYGRCFPFFDYMNEVRILGRKVNFENLTLSTDLIKPSHFSTSSELKSSPLAYLDKGTTNSQIHNQTSVRKSKSERLEVRSKTRDKLVEILADLGEDKKAESMARCGQKFDVLTCGQHIVAKTAYHRCNVRYCPCCASRRANRYQKKYLPFALDFVKFAPVKLTPCLLTFTQRKIKGEKVKDTRERVLKSFKKVIRHSFFKVYFDGGIFAVENTVSDEGNHCHIHAVVFRKKFIDVALLKKHWASVSDGAKNLNIKLIYSLETGLKECLKYISKPIPADTLQRSHVEELMELAGKRMLETFGSFRKFCQVHELLPDEIEEREKLEEGQCCPNCEDKGSLLFSLTMTERQLIDFYKRLESVRGSPPVMIH